MPASIMSTTEISARPPNMTMSPYMHVEPANHASESLKRPGYPDSQYWRYDTSQKRQRKGGSNGEKLCFKFTSIGSCSQGMKCNFRHDEESRAHYMRNVCFDFLNKGKCERGPDCKFGHSLTEEGASFSQNMQPHRSVVHLSLFLLLLFFILFRKFLFTLSSKPSFFVF